MVRWILFPNDDAKVLSLRERLAMNLNIPEITTRPKTVDHQHMPFDYYVCREHRQLSASVLDERPIQSAST